MPQEYLGLFDTPPGRPDVRAGIVIVGMLLAAFLVLWPLGNAEAREVSAFVPTIDAVVIASDLIIATLLCAQASVFRSRALTTLAAGYVFAAMLLIPHALTFPGAFDPRGLLEPGINTTAWLAMFRRLAFPSAVILYVFLKQLDERTQTPTKRSPATILFPVTAAIGLAGLATIVAVSGDNLLPPLFIDRVHASHANLLVMNSATILLTIAAIGMLLRQRISLLDLWLVVALVAWLMQSLLNLPLQARFTLGWYGLFFYMLASSLIVMLALVAESNRLYARLALSTAARQREREARLMTMDAVAGAIAHEVGQPLTSIGLNASVGLSSLTRDRPNVAKAIEALRAITDSGQRSFEIIKNIRAIVTRGPEWAIEFSLNDLVHESVTLLDRELAGAKVSLQLSLDDALPPVLANRVQMQQVIVNLVKNAIESLASARGRHRRILIRSVPLDDEKVLLEVSDSGPGIAPEDVWRVFETFHTTKTTGSGIGLALCRTIVEEHGGRIWASGGEKHGATFHVQLPRTCLSPTPVPTKH